MIFRMPILDNSVIITKNSSLNYKTIHQAWASNKKIILPEDAPPIPKIPDLYAKVFRWIAKNPEKFDMDTWQTADGEKCIGGIALMLGGQEAEDLIKYFSGDEGISAALIYLENVGQIPDFTASNYEALLHVISNLDLHE